MGQALLNALGYPLKRDRTAASIWELVKHHLRERETLFLHIDEAQDLYSDGNKREMQSVVNTLKSLMQNKDWPVGLILSGMPSLKTMLNSDPQLARRIFPIEFEPITQISHGDDVVAITQRYIGDAGLDGTNDLSKFDFSARLIHAASNEFGLVIELIIAAIEEALIGESESVGSLEFTQAFRRRAGCVDGLNPFVVDDFKSIDARQVLGTLDQLS